ncbi:hypothetical protein AB4Z25_11840 [Rhizobium sp. RAF36]|uniref:hypothetical protein n=1 Tax=Rhizobium sp. RAF36 TaxID=3233055 RepID=UPI003F9502EF
MNLDIVACLQLRDCLFERNLDEVRANLSVTVALARIKKMDRLHPKRHSIATVQSDAMRYHHSRITIVREVRKFPMAIDLTAANALPPLSNKLFRIFARFEFALKMAGFAEMRRGKVEIAWDRFSNSVAIGPAFLQHLRDHNICPTILDAPPKADLIENGSYGFEQQVGKPNCIQDLFGAVRRVRNNLFHGGKYFDDDKRRNRLFVREAIAILLLAAEKHPDINFYFEGRA